LGGGKGGMDPTRVKRVLGEVGTSSVLSIVVYEQFVRSAGTPKTDGG
jgi:hypothetical protein